MFSAIHLNLDIITYFIYQLYLQKWFSSDEVPDNRFLTEFFFPIKNIIDGLFCYFPCHTLFFIFSDKIAILTG